MLFGKILTINSPFNLRNISSIEQITFYELFFYNIGIGGVWICVFKQESSVSVLS